MGSHPQGVGLILIHSARYVRFPYGRSLSSNPFGWLYSANCECHIRLETRVQNRELGVYEVVRDNEKAGVVNPECILNYLSNQPYSTGCDESRSRDCLSRRPHQLDGESDLADIRTPTYGGAGSSIAINLA